MATVKYTTLFGSEFGLGELISFKNNLATKEKGEADLVLRDRNTGNFVVLEGENLRYKNGALAGGTITDINFTDADGNSFVVFSDAHYDAGVIGVTLKQENLNEFFFKILNSDDHVLGTRVDDYLFGAGHNDTLEGRGGEDQLLGRAGTDRETGGAGSDHFMFTRASELDIVTDFDAAGGGKQQDYIATNLDYVSIEQNGDDTIVDFGDGNRMKLLDVDASQVTDEDFVALLGGT